MTDAIGSAIFSPCGAYRYLLERPAPEGVSGPVLGFVMVNPSTADQYRDDQTIRMVRLFGKRHGYGRVLIGNIFAYRSRDIAALGQVEDPVGPDNASHLGEILRGSDRCFVGWGALAKLPAILRQEWRNFADMAERSGVRLYCLDHLKDGHPRHPQILRYRSPLTPWRRPAD